MPESNTSNTRLSSSAPPTTITIRPSKGWVPIKLGELWNYHELLLFLIWRDISVRYKQTVLGAAWAIIQPFFTMVVFTIFFVRLSKMPSDGLPYELFAYSDLVPWTFFASGLQGASNSLVGNANLLTKVYFPRLIITSADVISGIVDFGLAFLVLIVLMLLYGRMPTANIIFLPFLLLLALGTALGVGLWLSALNVQFRDVRYIVPFLVQFWLFATPIAYPSSLIKDPVLHTLYGINPMAGVVGGFRWALLGLQTAPRPLIFLFTPLHPPLFGQGALYSLPPQPNLAD